MTKRRKILITTVIFLVSSVVFIAFCLRAAARPDVPLATINFIGFTNAASGLKGRFEIRNRSHKSISRSGYCYVNRDVVDIMPTRDLIPGEVETVNVPITTYLGNSLNEPLRSITFNGARSLTIAEEVALALDGILETIGLRSKWGPQNRWELKYEFAVENEDGPR